MSEQFYIVGHIVNTHGLRGEVKILPKTDFPEERFAKGSHLYVFKPDNDEPQSVTIASSKLHKNMYIVKFTGIDHINDVEQYKGATIKVNESDRESLAEDEYYYNEIIDCRVVTDEGELLGTITEILAPGANDVWVVTSKDGQSLLLPVIDDVVLNVDIAKKEVKVHVMEGLR